MRYTEKRTYNGMGQYIRRKWWDNELEPSDFFQDSDTTYAFAQFGRRVIEDVEGLPIQYERFDTVAEACERMDELHDRRPPDMDSDAIIHDGGDRYCITFEGMIVGMCHTQDEAERRLAEYMVESGCFPDSFYNNRGNTYRIDDIIREYHDEGGTKMRPEYA